MKKTIALSLVLALSTMALSGCAATPAPSQGAPATPTAEVSAETPKTADKLVLKWGEVNPDGHPMAMGATEMARIVGEKTDGRINIDPYFSGTLGDEKTSMQGLQIGAMDMFRGNVVSMEDFNVKGLTPLALPYVFRDLEHLSAVLRSDMGEEYLKRVEQAGAGFVALGYMEEGPRNMFFTKKKVEKLADLKGLKIRVPETQLMMDTMKALGASPTPISYSELYTSMQTGVVDGAENGITGYATNNFYEVAPYYIKDAHTFGTGIVLIAQKSWDKLTADDQAVMRTSAKETQDYVLSITGEKEEAYYKQVVDAGTTIVEISDVEAWQEAASKVWATYGEETVKEIAAIQAIK